MWRLKPYLSIKMLEKEGNNNNRTKYRMKPLGGKKNSSHKNDVQDIDETEQE